MKSAGIIVISILFVCMTGIADVSTLLASDYELLQEDVIENEEQAYESNQQAEDELLEEEVSTEEYQSPDEGGEYSSEGEGEMTGYQYPDEGEIYSEENEIAPDDI